MARALSIVLLAALAAGATVGMAKAQSSFAVEQRLFRLEQRVFALQAERNAAGLPNFDEEEQDRKIRDLRLQVEELKRQIQGLKGALQDLEERLPPADRP